MNDNNEAVVGIILYHDSEEKIEFTDPEDYLTEIKKAFYNLGIHGWTYWTVSDDPYLKLATRNFANNEDEERIIANNRARISSDMPEIVRMLTELEKYMGGTPGLIGEWMRTSYEINEDFDLAPAEQVQEICSALRDVRHQYGIDIARELYNSQAVVLPTEIRSAGNYLHHGGQFSHLKALAYHGVLIDGYEDMDYDEIRELIEHMNGGGTVKDFQNRQEDDCSPTMV